MATVFQTNVFQNNVFQAGVARTAFQPNAFQNNAFQIIGAVASSGRRALLFIANVGRLMN